MTLEVLEKVPIITQLTWCLPKVLMTKSDATLRQTIDLQWNYNTPVRSQGTVARHTDNIGARDL